MKLKQAKELLNSFYESGFSEEQLDNMDLVVITSEPSIGGRSCSTVDSINFGFDWEMNRINITTEHKLKKIK